MSYAVFDIGSPVGCPSARTKLPERKFDTYSYRRHKNSPAQHIIPSWMRTCHQWTRIIDIWTPVGAQLRARLDAARRDERLS
ncbi:hypothetical protein NMY22_g179 [Coprinellus aureogranulatus]|nr:hypothetical protein NMY22_g179 [Coprinellus aureogranulatus]